MPTLTEQYTPYIPLVDEKVEIAAVHPLGFEIRYRERSIIGKTGLPERALVAEEWVTWAKKGVAIPCTLSDAIRRVKLDKPVWLAIEDHYKAWKSGSGEEVVVNGTPLSIWGGIHRDIVEMLKPFRIFSVEDLAVISDEVLQRIPHPDIINYRTRAKKFLDTKEIAQAVKEISDKDELLLGMKAKMDDLEKKLADAMLQAQSVEEAAPKKTRRAKEAA